MMERWERECERSTEEGRERKKENTDV